MRMLMLSPVFVAFVAVMAAVRRQLRDQLRCQLRDQQRPTQQLRWWGWERMLGVCGYVVATVVVSLLPWGVWGGSPQAHAQAFLKDGGYSFDLRAVMSHFSTSRPYIDGNGQTKVLQYGYGSVDTQLRVGFRFLPYIGGEALISFPTFPTWGASLNTLDLTNDLTLVRHQSPRPDMIASMSAIVFYPIFDTMPPYGLEVGWNMSVYGKLGVSYIVLNRQQSISFVDKTGKSQEVRIDDQTTNGMALNAAIGLEIGLSSRAWLAGARLGLFVEARVDYRPPTQLHAGFIGLNLQIPF